MKITRILIVEDNNVLAKLMDLAVRSGLGETEAQVGRAATMDAAVALVDEGGGYNLYLLDHYLEDGTGLEFLRHLRDGGDNAPVVFLTAEESERSRAEAMVAGATRYLVKGPRMMEEVRQMVEEYVGGEE